MALLATTTLAFGQTNELFRITRPAGTPAGWGAHFLAPGDLNGDGVGDLVVGSFHHGGGTFASVHSGATGAHLFDLTVPFEPLFYGAGLAAVADTNGDGVRDLVALGTRSGDANSHEGRILIHSGADGSILSQLSPPAGLSLSALSPHSMLVLGDIDGDGAEDFLCRTFSTGPHSGKVTLFSGATGVPIYEIPSPGGGGANIVDGTPHLSDHDGDGVRDFALAVFAAPDRFLQVHSGATGALIRQHANANLSGLTGNREPFLDVEDRDGDGKRDIAAGSVFLGFASVSSTADGAMLQAWDCESEPVPCLGSRMVEVGDLNGNGSVDLLTLDRPFAGSAGATLMGVDPATGEIVFSEVVPGMDDGYSSADRMIALPGADPKGHPSFAILEGINGYVSVRRYAPRTHKDVPFTNRP